MLQNIKRGKDRKMAQIITLANNKGGNMKSTTAQLLGNGLRHKGYKVLFIDLDAQGNLSYALGLTQVHPSAYDVLIHDVQAQEAINQTAQGDLIPASSQLARLDIDLSAETGREYRLAEALEPIEDQYDFIIIDTPPALSTVVINALTASDKVIIPTQADAFSLLGISQLAQTLQTVKKYTNPRLEIVGILISRFNSRTIYSQEVADMLEETAKELDTHVFNTKIREAIAVKEAQGLQVDLFDYAPKSAVLEDVKAFIEELDL